jgi:hypothetical protein
MTVQSIEDLVIELAGKKNKKHHKHAKADKENKSKAADRKHRDKKKPDQSLMEESVINVDNGISLQSSTPLQQSPSVKEISP